MICLLCLLLFSIVNVASAAVVVIDVPAGRSPVRADSVGCGDLVVIDTGEDSPRVVLRFKVDGTDNYLQDGGKLYIAAPCHKARLVVEYYRIDWDAEQFDVRDIVVNVEGCGPGPDPDPDDPDNPDPPDPEPDPETDCSNVPPDQFNNVGKAACAALANIPADAMSRREPLRLAYMQAADDMHRPASETGLHTYSDGLRHIKELTQEALGPKYDAWRPWRTAIADTLSGVTAGRSDLDEFFRAIAGSL